MMGDESPLCIVVPGFDVYLDPHDTESLEKDRKRLEWLMRNPCYVAYSNDGDNCWLHWCWDPHDEERGPWNGPMGDSPRAVIDQAMESTNAYN